MFYIFIDQPRTLHVIFRRNQCCFYHIIIIRCPVALTFSLASFCPSVFLPVAQFKLMFMEHINWYIRKDGFAWAAKNIPLFGTGTMPLFQHFFFVCMRDIEHWKTTAEHYLCKRTNMLRMHSVHSISRRKLAWFALIVLLS